MQFRVIMVTDTARPSTTNTAHQPATNTAHHTPTDRTDYNTLRRLARSVTNEIVML